MNKDPNLESASDQNAPLFKNQRDEIQTVLSHLFDVIFPAAITFGAVALLFSIYRSLHSGWHFTIILYISMYLFALLVLVFRHYIPPRLTFCFLLGLMYISIIQSLYTMGLAGEGMMTLVLLSVFTGVFLGIRAGIIAVVIGVLAVSVMGSLICGGVIPTGPDITDNLIEPVTWIVQISLALLYVIPLILIINYMRERIIESLGASSEMNKRLQEEIKTRIVVENNLRESEEKYKSVVENSLVAFYIIQDKFFRFVNPRFCAITGYQYDEIIDKMGPLDLVHPDDFRKIEEIIREFLQGVNTENEYEVKITRKDGSVTTIRVFSNSIIYNGKTAYFGTAIDVGKERLLEAKLVQAQKMEAIGTLTGGIAHDFNNILTALTGYGTMLQMQMEDTDPLKRYADQILYASEKAANLTKSLLAFSRMQPVSLKPVNINAVVEEIGDLLRRLLTEDIIFETDLAPRDLNILADDTQMEQILFNLVTNARDAMPDGGTLKIATGIAELNEEFILNNGFGKKGRYALLSVSDNGMGMDLKTKERIFEPFFTTKEKGKGTGLGLSTVYGIVKQHFGYIAVHSEAGKGTEFHVYLPLIKKKDASDTQKSSVSFRKGAETILVADDNGDVRSFIKELLGKYGYRVIEAMDGDEAVKKFDENREISLVITDAIMPKRSGKYVCDSIKEMRPDACMLFMSGYPKEVLLAKGIIEPGVQFISKPISPEEFLKKASELLEKQCRQSS